MLALIALVALALALLAALALVALGLVVIKRHPGDYDPARSAKRYTRPALALFLIALFGTVAFFAFGLAWLIVG